MQVMPLILVIIDGFGIATKEEEENSIVNDAIMPNMRNLLQLPTVSQLQASGRAVGLPVGYMGNSEVGHLTIGSGRVINQSFVAIEESITDGRFFILPELVSAIEITKANGGRLHCMGLLSSSGVHGQLSHFIAMVSLAKRYEIEVFFHIFTDGRDAGVFEGIQFIQALESTIKKEGFGNIASVIGRYYAMDRDNRWERTEKAYAMLVEDGTVESDVYSYLESEYIQGKTDEFIEPAILLANSRIKNQDSVFFLNFRADRAKQLTTALLGKAPFSSHYTHLELTACITMTRYAKDLETIVLFEKEIPNNTLGEILSANGLRQLRIAETEKYAHVTYFFNGGKEGKNEKEERCLIPSPQDVPTYDKKPEMSAYQVTQTLCDAINAKEYDVYICNFANLDMIGHTGNIEAGKQALCVIDECIGKIVGTVRLQKGVTIITADHGNIEALQNNAKDLHTAHTCNDVYCIIDLPKESIHTVTMRDGELQDIAPTILYLLGIDKPKEMQGKSLISDTF